jgi:predicted phosphohydrolase
VPKIIQYCSDLHLEFDLNNKWIKKHPLTVKGEILLIAGDLMPFTELDHHNNFFNFAADHYSAVYWIPGNHEYYGSDISDRSGAFREAIRSNVFLLNNTTETIGDIALICSTMWSKIDPEYDWNIRRAMSDFHVIKNGREKLSIATYNELHNKCREYINNALANSGCPKKIVMTHHVPTFMNYPEKYRGDLLNMAFATEMYDYIHQSDADYWIYGHTHANTPDFTIGNTHLRTNQLGYVRYGEHTSFDNAKVITL